MIVQLFIDSKVSRYFQRKPLNKTQRVLKVYDDESCDIELTITDYMEIIPTIQRYIPHVGVIEPDELKTKVNENVKIYLKQETAKEELTSPLGYEKNQPSDNTNSRNVVIIKRNSIQNMVK